MVEELNYFINENESILWAYSHKHKYSKRWIKKINLYPPISEEERKNYKDVFILTNKRWIQKELWWEVHKYIKKYSEELVKRERDIISVDIEDIKLWFMIDTIGIYVDMAEYEADKRTYLGAEVSECSMQSLIDILLNLPQFEYKKEKHGVKIFYQKGS